MICDQANEALERAALGPRERMDVDDLAAHVRACPDCRDLAADLLLLGAASAPPADETPPAVVVPARGGAPWIRPAAATAAALLLFAVGLGAGLAARGEGPRPAPPVGAATVVKVGEDVLAPRLPALDPHDYERGFLAGKTARVYSADD